MGTVDGLTAARMIIAKNKTIVSGAVVGNNLILTKADGTTVDAGNVKGPTGTTFPPPKLYTAKSTSVASITSSSTTITTGWAYLEGDSALVTISGDNFIINEAGIYHINFSVTIGGTSEAGRRIAFIYQSSSELRRCDVAASFPCTVQAEDIKPLALSASLNFRVYQSSGAAQPLGASPGHLVNILKLY